MEAFGIAGGTITFVSFLIQLADKTQTILDFWSSIRDAPEYVHDIAHDLEQVRELLRKRVEKVAVPNTLLLEIVEKCARRIQKLERILDRLEPGFRSQRRIIRLWYSYKTLLRKNDIKEIQDSLRDAKFDLIIANQNEEYVLFLYPKHLCANVIDVIMQCNLSSYGYTNHKGL